MNERETNGTDQHYKLKSSFRSSDDSRSFALAHPSGLAVCLVFVGSSPDTAALGWLESFFKERFEQAFQETTQPGRKGSLVSFFQRAHVDLFGERTKWPDGLDRISLVAARLHGDTIEIASVGTCAVYRMTASGIERVIPSEGNGGEGCYLGASLKVSVEMVKRSLAIGVTYILTSTRIDLSGDRSSTLGETLRVTGSGVDSTATAVFGGAGGALVVLECVSSSEDNVEEDANVVDDVRWYTRLRGELASSFHGRDVPAENGCESVGRTPVVSTARPRAEKKRPVSAMLKRTRFVFLAVAVGMALYIFSIHGGKGGVKGFLSGGRAVRDGSVTGRTSRSGLSLNSTPPGAEVILDDSVIGSRTPVSVLDVRPGTHRIAMRLGEIGEWSGSVAVGEGDTADVRVAFVGEIEVNSGPRDGLSVFVDGRQKGFTPCVVDSVPVGLHVVKVEGKDVPAWEEEVIVTNGSIARVQVNPGKLPATGTVRITAGQVSEQGYEESGGRAVFVDKKKVGVTPVKLDVKPGFHSVRVVGTRGEAASVTVVQVRPGGKHFIRAEFTGAQPLLVECSHTRVSSIGQLIVCVSLTGNAEAEVSRVEVYLEKTNSNRAGWETMSLLPGSRAVYAAAVPEGLATDGGQVRYFARVTTSDGAEYFSEVGSMAVP